MICNDCRGQQAFVVLTEANNNDVMTIMEIQNGDYGDALRQYLDADMNLEAWSQRAFD